MIARMRRRVTLLVILFIVLVTAGIVAAISIANYRGVERQAMAALETLTRRSGRPLRTTAQEAESTPPPKPDDDEDGEQEDIFSPEYFEKLSDVKMPASKLELLIKMLRKQITEYGKINQVAAKQFKEMLEKTIAEYHERRKHLTAEEAGEAQEQTSEEIIRSATKQALDILRAMNADRESFRKVGLTFEEKAFYDILMTLRDQYNFEYGTDKVVNGVSVNDKCKSLAKKIKEIIDTKSSFADWLNNQIVRDQLKFDIKICLIKNGYPPQYSPEVFRKVMEQVENFEENA